ncbi:MAG: radical SAM protein [Trueperaceae bacterium]|nr:radical SAM protein [Trueperaceae bacterium]
MSKRIVIELTNRCNLACQHCFSGRHGGNDDLSLDLLEKVFGEAKRLGFEHLTFTGGDPTVYRYFAELLAKVAEYNYRFSFVTNGYNFTASHKKILPYLDWLEQITFSLDGATEESHGALRGKHSFRQVIAAMKLAKSLDIPFSNNMVVTRHNYLELRDLAELVYSLGSKGLRFGHLMHSPLTTAKGWDLSLDERQQVEANIWQLQADYAQKLPIAMAPGFSTEQLFPCAPLNMMEVNIDAHGNISKCCHLSSHGPIASQDDVVGNLATMPFSEGVLKLFAANERFKRLKQAYFEKAASQDNKSPCWYCSKHFRKVDWLKQFPENPWFEYLNSVAETK